MAKSRNGTASLAGGSPPAPRPCRESAGVVRPRPVAGASMSALAADSAGTTAVVSLAMIRLVTATTLSVWPVMRVRLVQVAQQRRVVGILPHARPATT